jgi:hypothetical protein
MTNYNKQTTDRLLMKKTYNILFGKPYGKIHVM